MNTKYFPLEFIAAFIIFFSLNLAYAAILPEQSSKALPEEVTVPGERPGVSVYPYRVTIL